MSVAEYVETWGLPLKEALMVQVTHQCSSSNQKIYLSRLCLETVYLSRESGMVRDGRYRAMSLPVGTV